LLCLYILLFPCHALSQSLTLFDIDASAYPTMRAKFYAFDADGNQLPGLAPGDVQLREDGVARTVTRRSSMKSPGTPMCLSPFMTCWDAASRSSQTRHTDRACTLFAPTD
jgi:hypothetical protein